MERFPTPYDENISQWLERYLKSKTPKSQNYTFNQLESCVMDLQNKKISNMIIYSDLLFNLYKMKARGTKLTSRGDQIKRVINLCSGSDDTSVLYCQTIHYILVNNPFTDSPFAIQVDPELDISSPNHEDHNPHEKDNPVHQST